MKWFLTTLFVSLSLASLAQDGYLRTIREINEFLSHGHGKTNYIISAQVISDPKDVALIVQDETGRTVVGNTMPKEGGRTGDLLRIEGYVSINPNGESWTQPVTALRYGHAPAPAPADLTLSELNNPDNALLPVRVTGSVFSATPDEFDERYMILILGDGKATTPVFLTKEAYTAAHVQTESTIRLTGFYWRSLSGTRKYTGPCILHDARAPVETLSPPPADPFSAPALERRFYAAPEEIAQLGPRTITGRVLATWGRNNVMVRTDENRVVNIVMQDGATVPSVDETGVFVGYPYTDLVRVNLTRGRFKPCAIELPAESTDCLSIDELVAGNQQIHESELLLTRHGRLVRLRGTLLGLPSENSPEQRLYLDCGVRQVTVDVSACREVVQTLVTGSELEVLGRCQLETESGRSDNFFPSVRGFTVIARTPADITVTKLPPWWTPGRLLMIIGIVLAGLVGALVWVFALHRLAERRGQELYRSQQARTAEQQAREVAELRMQDRTRLAVELHDTISQNLTGATLQMGTAAQLVGTDNAQAVHHIDIATRTLDSCREELRNCIWDLRSNTLDEKDLNEAIRKTVQRIVGETKLQIRFNIPREKLSDNTVHALMQIVRELATNAVRHGGATALNIAGALENGRLSCSVADNGCGFDNATRPGLAEGHFGLQGVEERIDELGGELTIESQPGKGTRIAFSIIE